MYKYKIIIEYDGSNFVGWQSQENGLSVQKSIEESINNIVSEKVIVDRGSGAGTGGVIPYLPLPELKKRSGGQ